MSIMKTLSPIAACFVLALALGAAEIRNPGFEKGFKSFEGVGNWWFSTADSCDYDTEVFHTGKRSIRLTVHDGISQKASPHWSRYAHLKNPLQGIKPDTVYTIRCFIKTDMKEGQAGIAIVENKKKMTMPERVPVKFLPIRSTTDWTELVYSFKTDKETTGVELYCAAENFTGRAWFDDFSISEGIDIPAVPCTSRWDDALILNGFILVGQDAVKREQPKAQTELRLISDGDKLRIRGRCLEPDMKNLKATVEGRDSAVWKDDCVDLFIDAQRSRTSSYHFIINANGALYDADGKDVTWSPPDIQCSASKEEGSWTFELEIPYTSIGYGQMEAGLPDKQMGFAAFRIRRCADAPNERSSWQPWTSESNFDNAMLYPAITAGSGTNGKAVSFLYRGQTADFTRPPLAWQMDDPLYEELMSDVPMFPEKGSIVNIAFRGNGTRPEETAFALQHGMKKHYEETDGLMKEMRSVYNMITLQPKGRVLVDKYAQRVSIMPMPQFGGAYYGYDFRSDAPKFKYFAGGYFYPDPRVREAYAKHVKALLEANKDVIDEVTLGHEGRIVFFRSYDLIREAYMKEDPEAWKKMEEQAKQEYGHGRVGFPESFKSATPLERMVYQRFVYTEYNKAMQKLAEEIRRIKPGIRIISELDPDGIKPYFYEQIVGTYDFICQQMLWGQGVNRQSVGWNCKILTDLAETPARGGPHIEHYFVTLNPDEVNEVISSVFRTGGESLQLWLHDWFGKTLGDYYGAPERLREVVRLTKLMASMRKLKFPEPDCAILFGNVDQTTKWTAIGGLGGGHEEAFTVLGPRARSWFKFISDTQLSLGRTDLSKNKVIYDPGAVYFEDDAYRKLSDYVKDGGTLVVADPMSFSLRTDGSKRDTAPLFGVTAGEKRAKPGEMKIVPDARFPKVSQGGLLASGDARHLDLNDGTTILAAYPDGTPAITVHPFGKGNVIVFAATPFVPAIYSSVPWQNFFRALQQDLGCAVDRDIWRFRFPRAAQASVPQVPENLTCLTGNSWYYEADTPAEGPNANLKFTVSYEVPPDFIPDNPEKDKLFNRKQAMNAKVAGNMKEGIIPWTVAWDQAKTPSVTFSFPSPVAVRKVRLWAAGEIPEMEFGILDSGHYRQLGTAPVPVSEKGDVREIVLDFPPCSGRDFILKIKKEKPGVFYLGEAELWGEPQLTNE